MADLRGKAARLGALMAELGVQRDCESMYLSGCYSSVMLSPLAFCKLLRSHKVHDFKAERSGEFLHAQCKFRNVHWKVAVWSKQASDMHTWELINSWSPGPSLEAKLPRLAVKRTAIEDKRRPLGLTAPEVVDA